MLPDPIASGVRFACDQDVMRRALQIAQAGIGFVEPNPPVGAVIVDSRLQFVAEGYHRKFGEAHAEVNAIEAACGNTRGNQIFVTLEPCSHYGKTPPCADAVIAAGFQRVVIGCQDPAGHVDGSGIDKLRRAGLDVSVGVCELEAQKLIAPFRQLQLHQRPWVHAKWAMTLDGRIAARTGHSQWISSEASRQRVHELRGRMDAIITGAGTVKADNPTLTARPAGPRTPLRVVIDSAGTAVSVTGNLVQTIDQAPLLLCVSQSNMDVEHCRDLANAGVEIFPVTGSRSDQIRQLVKELGRRRCTHVLLEAGAGLLGQCFDDRLIDEVHVFVAPKLVGGQMAMSPIGGIGVSEIPVADSLEDVSVTPIGTNVLIEGRIGSNR